MIDAGSTGSEPTFTNSPIAALPPNTNTKYEVVKMNISSRAGNPDGAARSLGALLDEAVRVVPYTGFTVRIF